MTTDGNKFYTKINTYWNGAFFTFFLKKHAKNVNEKPLQ